MPVSRAWNAIHQDAKSFVIRIGAIALALILHVIFYIWVTIPPKLQDMPESAPLKVVFVKMREPKQLSAPQPPPTSHAHVSTAHVEVPKHAIRVTTASPPDPSATSRSSTPAIPAYPSQPPPEPQAVPYGNDRFQQALTHSLQEGPTRIPGVDEPVKVAGIHVQTSSSIAEILSETGHVLNCKDAIFKGRMTDEELAKRGLTEQQMLMKYSELGCP